MWRVQSGCGKRIYSLDRKCSIPSCPFATLSSPNVKVLFYTWGGKKNPKQISLASRHTARTKTTSLQVAASFCHPTLFVCLPGRSVGKWWQKHNIRFLLRWWQQGTALGQRLLEERARLPPGPISNVAALSARGLSAVMNMTASGLCAAPFIPFERK